MGNSWQQFVQNSYSVAFHWFMVIDASAHEVLFSGRYSGHNKGWPESSWMHFHCLSLGLLEKHPMFAAFCSPVWIIVNHWPSFPWLPVFMINNHYYPLTESYHSLTFTNHEFTIDWTLSACTLPLLPWTRTIDHQFIVGKHEFGQSLLRWWRCWWYPRETPPRIIPSRSAIGSSKMQAMINHYEPLPLHTSIIIIITTTTTTKPLSNIIIYE